MKQHTRLAHPSAQLAHEMKGRRGELLKELLRRMVKGKSMTAEEGNSSVGIKWIFRSTLWLGMTGRKDELQKGSGSRKPVGSLRSCQLLVIQPVRQLLEWTAENIKALWYVTCPCMLVHAWHSIKYRSTHFLKPLMVYVLIISSGRLFHGRTTLLEKIVPADTCAASLRSSRLTIVSCSWVFRLQKLEVIDISEFV